EGPLTMTRRWRLVFMPRLFQIAYPVKLPTERDSSQSGLAYPKARFCRAGAVSPVCQDQNSALDCANEMHIDLAQLDSEALELVSSPPGTPSEAQQHVRLSQLRGLSGQLSKTRDSLRLSSAHAKEAVIDALSLAFGRVA